MSAGVAKPAPTSALSDPKSAPLKEIPDILVDPRTTKSYTRGRFLGKGGFAKCYEITDVETKQVFAGKIVPKSLILKQHQREKMTSEIAIHKSLNHPNIVGFHGFFEDDDFVFVVLEICRRRVSAIIKRSTLSKPLHFKRKEMTMYCNFKHPYLCYGSLTQISNITGGPPGLQFRKLEYVFFLCVCVCLLKPSFFSLCWSCTSGVRLSQSQRHGTT